MSLGKSTDAADHIGLAAKIARPFARSENCPVMDSEAFADAILHFVKCKKWYDPSKEVLFTSYAGNMAARVLKRQYCRRAFRAAKLSYGLEDWQVNSSSDSEAVDGVDCADQMEEVRIAMRKLDDRMRDVVERRLQRQTFKEIGRAYGYTGAWAEQLYLRAVKILRDLLVV